MTLTEVRFLVMVLLSGNRSPTPTSGREDVKVGELLGHTGKSRSYHAAPLGACAPRSRSYCLASVSRIPDPFGCSIRNCPSGLPCSIRSEGSSGTVEGVSGRRVQSGGFPFPLRLR